MGEVEVFSRGRVRVQICGVLPEALRSGETVLFCLDLANGQLFKLLIRREIKDSFLLLKGKALKVLIFPVDYEVKED